MVRIPRHWGEGDATVSGKSQRANVARDALRAFGKAQNDALASCYWAPCPGCRNKVPLIKAVGVPAAGFRSFHKASCAA